MSLVSDILSLGINPFTVALASLIWLILTFLGILVMHFLMPQNIAEKYFKPPYFSIFEPAYFTGKVLAVNRTVMFMTVIAFPRLGKKRKLTKVYKEVPGWYRVASRLILIALFSLGFVFFGSLFGYELYSWIFNHR